VADIFVPPMENVEGGIFSLERNGDRLKLAEGHSFQGGSFSWEQTHTQSKDLI
jgi:hypothetical protein